MENSVKESIDAPPNRYSNKVLQAKFFAEPDESIMVANLQDGYFEGIWSLV